MALDDFLDSEVGIAVAATALVLSPQVRQTVRRGAVYGLATLMRLGDTAGSAARGVAGGVQTVASDGASAAQSTVEEAKTVARGSSSRSTTRARNTPGKAGEG